jgi:hypothetical protein
MPAHQPDISHSQALPILQQIWSYLAKQDFVIYPNSKYLNQTEHASKYLILDPFVAMEEVKDFKLSLQRAFALQAILKSNYSQLQSEWNYLGKNEERGAYFEYLTKFFWANQDNLALQQSLQFAQILEQPWLILEQIDKLDTQPQIVTDWFGPSTTDFINSLSDSMKTWELNPFLIHSSLGSLQWKLEIPDKVRLLGCLYNSDKKLICSIQMHDLTLLS